MADLAVAPLIIAITIIVETAIVGQLAVFEDTEDHGAAAVGACVLGEVVTTGELLAALVALEWLVLCVEGAVVALEMFLATEATVAELADEGLGWVLGEGLLATTSVDRCLCWRSAARLRASTSCVIGGVV